MWSRFVSLSNSVVVVVELMVEFTGTLRFGDNTNTTASWRSVATHITGYRGEEDACLHIVHQEMI